MQLWRVKWLRGLGLPEGKLLACEVLGGMYRRYIGGARYLLWTVDYHEAYVREILRTGRRTRALALTAALLAGFPAWAGAQDSRRSQATRAELQASLAELEKYAASSGYSSRLRGDKSREAALIRARLENGDLQVGDQIEIQVAGQTAFSDTFAVASGRVLTLPGIPDIPLQGVLRSEAQEYLSKQLSRYIRDPEVRVRTMIRLNVFGSVGKPGFYHIPADVLATEAFMIAGGPAADADPSKVFVRRGGAEIWGPEALQEAMRLGITLDQLNLRAGDELVLDPRKRPGGVSVLTIMGALAGVTSTVYFLTTIF